MTTRRSTKPARNLYGTHVPILAWLASRVDAGETVVEFGAGDNSTPLLRMFAAQRGFHVHTFESIAAWSEDETPHASQHRLSAESLDGDLATVRTMRPALVFVDNGFLIGRETHRAKIVRELLPWSRWVVAHDTEPERAHVYRYDFRSAKYVQHWTRHGIRTTALSCTDPILRTRPDDHDDDEHDDDHDDDDDEHDDPRAMGWVDCRGLP